MKIRPVTPLPQDEIDRLTSPPEMKVIYSVERPSGEVGRVEVYGDPARNWYDWRIIDGNGEVVRDTAVKGSNWGQYSDDARALDSALHHDGLNYAGDGKWKLDEAETIHSTATSGRGGLQ